MRWDRGAMVLTPLVAVATLAAGLRIGASPALRAAIVYGAPPAAGHRGLAWQIVTIVDDRGVREAIELAHVSVYARARGSESRWEGSTNADGVAEVWLDLPGVVVGDSVQIEVRTAGEASPLAVGLASWPEELPRGRSAPPAFVRSSRQDGDLVMDVAVYGGRLAPGFASSLWVRVTDKSTGAPFVGARIDADPEPGLAVQPDHVTTNSTGSAELAANAEIHVVALGLRASAGSGPARKSGVWFGAIPVAPGASFVAMPLTLAPREAHAFDVLVPTVLRRVYAEVDDGEGRAFATSLPVEHSRAALTVPPLEPGKYWLVTAGDPRGAESLEGAALARPFLVADPAVDRTSLGFSLTHSPQPHFSRFVVLDGVPAKRRADGSRHRRGLAIALGALGVAAALETLLVLRAVVRSKRLLALSDVIDEDSGAIEPPVNALSVGIGLLVALLGFALLAALLSWRAA